MNTKCLTVDTAKDGEPCYWSHQTIFHNGKVYQHSQYVWDNGYSMGKYIRCYDHVAQKPQVTIVDDNPF